MKYIFFSFTRQINIFFFWFNRHSKKNYTTLNLNWKISREKKIIIIIKSFRELMAEPVIYIYIFSKQIVSLEKKHIIFFFFLLSRAIESNVWFALKQIFSTEFQRLNENETKRKRNCIPDGKKKRKNHGNLLLLTWIKSQAIIHLSALSFDAYNHKFYSCYLKKKQ